MAASSPPRGLSVIPAFISRREAKALVAYLDQQEWLTEFKARRQQFYGSRYTALQKKADKPAPPMEGPVLALAEKIGSIYGVELGHCIVNEYGPTGSIGAHTDAGIYGDFVFGVSLVDHGSLEFSRKGRSSYQAYLPRRSLMVMSSDARWKWKHALKPTKTYPGPEGEKLAKESDYRRISLTFRYKKEV